jgi:hypothetical protein
MIAAPMVASMLGAAAQKFYTKLVARKSQRNQTIGSRIAFF